MLDELGRRFKAEGKTRTCFFFFFFFFFFFLRATTEKIFCANANHQTLVLYVYIKQIYNMYILYTIHTIISFCFENNVDNSWKRASRCSSWVLLTNTNCNETRTDNHLVRKRTPSHLAKLAKWLSRVVSTYLYGVFEFCVYNVAYMF